MQRLFPAMGIPGHTRLRKIEYESTGMGKPVDIQWYYQAEDLLEFAEKVETPEGNSYYRLPQWFQVNGRHYVMHSELPEDLSEFLTKAALGGDNPKVQPPKIPT